MSYCNGRRICVVETRFIMKVKKANIEDGSLE
jgi:hypothetical protein